MEPSSQSDTDDEAASSQPSQSGRKGGRFGRRRSNNFGAAKAIKCKVKKRRQRRTLDESRLSESLSSLCLVRSNCAESVTLSAELELSFETSQRSDRSQNASSAGEAAFLTPRKQGGKRMARSPGKHTPGRKRVMPAAGILQLRTSTPQKKVGRPTKGTHRKNVGSQRTRKNMKERKRANESVEPGLEPLGSSSSSEDEDAGCSTASMTASSTQGSPIPDPPSHIQSSQSSVHSENTVSESYESSVHSIVSPQHDVTLGVNEILSTPDIQWVTRDWLTKAASLKYSAHAEFSARAFHERILEKIQHMVLEAEQVVTEALPLDGVAADQEGLEEDLSLEELGKDKGEAALALPIFGHEVPDHILETRMGQQGRWVHQWMAQAGTMSPRQHCLFMRRARQERIYGFELSAREDRIWQTIDGVAADEFHYLQDPQQVEVNTVETENTASGPQVGSQAQLLLRGRAQVVGLRLGNPETVFKPYVAPRVATHMAAARADTVMAVQYYSVGDYRAHTCPDCGAYKFAEEKPNRQGKYMACCTLGRVKLAPLTIPERSWNTVLNYHWKYFSNYRHLISQYNSRMALASMQGDFRHFGQGASFVTMAGTLYDARVGGFGVPNSDPPKYAGVYYYREEEATEIRVQTAQGPRNKRVKIEEAVLRELHLTYEESNPHVRKLLTMREVIQKCGKEPKRIYLVCKDRAPGQNQNVQRPSAPTEVLAIHEGEPPQHNYFLISNRDGPLQSISNVNSMCDPFLYIGLFPCGEQGFEVGVHEGHVPQANARGSKGHNKTILQHYRYRMAEREGSELLHHGGPLFQQYVLHGFLRYEQDLIWYIKGLQKSLRADTFKNVEDFAAAKERGDEVYDKTGTEALTLPASHAGSPKWYTVNLLDALAIVRYTGKPTYMITFTARRRWPEVDYALELQDGQYTNVVGETGFQVPFKTKPEDRPDIIARVFKLKLDKLLHALEHEQVLGRCVSIMHVVEWQQRGLPHAHILLTVAPEDVPRTVEQLDSVICAEFPDEDDRLLDPVLFKVVTETMRHTKCGKANPKAPCMRNGACCKKYPKEFLQDSELPEEGKKAKYRRREGDEFKVTVNEHGKDVDYDNRDVVPYNKYLSKLCGSHVNILFVDTALIVSYLYKYIYKGHDCSRAVMRSSGDEPVDEIEQFLSKRCTSSSEGACRIIEVPIQKKNYHVEKLVVHLPGEHRLVHEEGGEAEALHNPGSKRTMLTAFFEINLQRKDDPTGLLYEEMPQHFTWGTKEKVWRPRKQFKGRGARNIGRLFPVGGRGQELASLLLLLKHVPSPVSFEDLLVTRYMSDPDFVSEKFTESAIAKGLCPDDMELVLALATFVATRDTTNHEEVVTLFACIVAYNHISDPRQFFIDNYKHMLDPSKSNTEKCPNGDPESVFHALVGVDRILYANGKSLLACGMLEERDYGPYEEQREHEELNPFLSLQGKDDESRAQLEALRETVDRRVASLNTLQLKLFNALKSALEVCVADRDYNTAKVFYVDGPGGSGKSYVFNTFLMLCEAVNILYDAVAVTGIAATVLRNGRTAHGAFGIPKNLHETSTSSIKYQSTEAERIRHAKVLVWDEAPMAPKTAISLVDRLMRDLTGRPDVPFGGRVVLFGGDVRQIPPVFARSHVAVSVENHIMQMPMWKEMQHFKLRDNMRARDGGKSNMDFRRWLLNVGCGKHERDPRCPQDENRILVPDRYLTEKDIISEVFGNPIDQRLLEECAILCPKNQQAEEINEQVLLRMKKPIRTYLAQNWVDHLESEVPPPGSLGELASSPNVGPHTLNLCVGATVMLLRNLDTQRGLCNGTRLSVIDMQDAYIYCQILNTANAGDFVAIPKITVSMDDTESPYVITRRQFPLRLCFAMTINKSQGQTLGRVGLYLTTPCFSHGQFYVACSRVRNPDDLFIMLKDDDGHFYDSTVNVVQQELLSVY